MSSSVLEMLQWGLLLLLLWICGKIEKLTDGNCPAIVLEIVVGMLLGPEVLDIVPHHTALEVIPHRRG